MGHTGWHDGCSRSIDAWTYSQLPRRSACNGSRGTSSTSTAPGLLFIYKREIDTPLRLNSLLIPRTPFQLSPPSPSGPFPARTNRTVGLFTVGTSHGGASRPSADGPTQSRHREGRRIGKKGDENIHARGTTRTARRSVTD